MISAYYMTAVVFLHWSTNGFAEGNSTVCNFRIEESEIEKVRRLMYLPTTNTINLKVVSGNKFRNLPEMTWYWANELGRTIISLVALAKETIFASPIFTTILTVGTEGVNIQVIEEPYGCLPSGNKGSDMIFDHLLHRLFQSEHVPYAEDIYFYKLCREHKNKYSYTTFNCCQITGAGNSTFCADYSSVVVKCALPTVILVFSISFFLVLPFVLQHIIFLESTKFYKTSESHMSLISIVSLLFFKGHGQARCFFRRAFFTGLSVLVFLPDFFGQTWLMWAFIAWASFFVLSDDVEDLLGIGTDEQYKKERVEPLDEKMISRLTEPFSYLYKEYNNYTEKDNCFSKIFETINKIFILKNICFIIFCFISSFAFIILAGCAAVYFFIRTIGDVLWSLVIPHKFSMIKERFGKKSVLFKFLIVVGFIIRLITSLLIVIFTGMIFVSAVSILVGLCLNVEFFNPFVAPITTIIVYFLKNWKFSVEIKCLQLKTLIFEVCKEKATKADSTHDDDSADTEMQYLAPVEEESDIIENKENTNGTNANGGRSCKLLKSLRYISKKEINNGQDVNNKGDGEAMISKVLFKEISDRIMPLNLLLFHFFRRVIFVVFYAFIMFTVMIVVRESAVSGSIRAISTIVAALIPFIFDTIWAEHMPAHKIAKKEAIKQKLEHLLKVFKHEEQAVIIIEVEVVGNDVNQRNNELGDVNLETADRSANAPEEVVPNALVALTTEV